MKNNMERKHSVYMINEIRDRMSDDKSKKIFDARIRYLIYRDEMDFLETINNMCEYDIDRIPQIGTSVKSFPNAKNLVIYGAGHNGIITMNMLRKSNVSLNLYFCDSDRRKAGSIICGTKVLSFAELIEKKNESVVVISAKNACMDIYNWLIFNGFPYQQIVIPMDNLPIVYFGGQYFDFFEPNTQEVFVDGGAYDGISSCEFVKWTNGDYLKTYIYEANDKNEQMIEKNLVDNDVKRYTIFGCGLWSDEAELNFYDENGRGASVNDAGNVKIKVNSIDNTINDRVTFIKMDIEGSEYEAILGAKNTIKKYRPRMAISIYHKPEDVLEIPTLILSIDKEYKFAIRHYSSGFFETVLYAWVEG